MKMMKRKKADTVNHENQRTRSGISATSINSELIFSWDVKKDQMTPTVSSVLSIIIFLYSLGSVNIMYVLLNIAGFL